MTPERLAEIRVNAIHMRELLGVRKSGAEVDLFDLLAAYEARAKELAKWQSLAGKDFHEARERERRLLIAEAALARAREALYSIIDLDHHNMGPEGNATKIARAALNELFDELRLTASEAALADMEAKAAQWEIACQQARASVADFQERETALRSALAKAREVIEAAYDDLESGDEASAYLVLKNNRVKG